MKASYEYKIQRHKGSNTTIQRVLEGFNIASRSSTASGAGKESGTANRTTAVSGTASGTATVSRTATTKE